MLGLFKAAAFLAPALELVSAAATELASTSRDIISDSFITLELGGDSNSSNPLQQTTLDLRVFESDAPCGYGNVTLNGEPLAQDDLGLGSGSVTTNSGSVLVAGWKFTCVDLEGEPAAQLLSVHVVSADGQNVDNTGFSVQFRQTAPVSISYIDGTETRVKLLSAHSSNDSRPDLDVELAELEMLKQQLVALERSIALKITHISDSFNLERSEELFQPADCRGLKCFFNKLYDRIRAMTSKPYHSDHRDQGPLTNRPGIPHWSSTHGSQRPLVGETYDMKIFKATPSLQEPGSVDGQDEAKDSMSTADEGASHPHQFSSSLSSQSFIDGPHRVIHIVVYVVVALAILINLAIMILMVQCVRLLRQRRKARWEKRRAQLRESRAACNALVATKYTDLIQWLRDGFRRENVEEQEKTDMFQYDIIQPDITRHDSARRGVIRQIYESDSDMESSDTMSITMEEEIARFRAAANAVGNLVVAEEGRGRSRLSEQLPWVRPRRASTPSSMLSSCPTYRSVDETLPAYEENCSPEYVVDGFQHTPNSSSPGNSSPRDSISRRSTICSSPDENLERKD